MTYYTSSTTALRFYDASSCSNTGPFAINFNGSAFPTATASTAWAAGNVIDLSTMTRYVQVPYTSAATTSPSLTVTFTNSGTTAGTTTTQQIVITNGSGKVLAVALAGVGSTQTTITATDTVTAGSSGSFYVLFTRVSDTTGGLRVWQTELTK
ncbi:hypothetical protein GCM10025770_17010 [Viridibacterium curvum]|uniref:Uncharacterized protein n=1 Tax=Viridibacterium curvum TaxID=1101404 RepID=A0ABP9QLH8_9RHOO